MASDGGTVLRLETGGDGNQLSRNRLSGTGMGSITGIDVESDDNVVTGNEINRISGGSGVVVAGMDNLIGPVVTPGSLGGNSNPDRNLVN